MGRAVARAIHEHWGLFLAEGIILVLLGIIAIVVPLIATLAFTILIGWLFLVSGIIGLITTFWARHAPGFWWSLISAIIAIAAGLVLLLWPVSGAISLTLVLIAFFIIEGIVSIMYAIEHRSQLTGRWVWMLLSGIIDHDPRRHHLAGLPGTAVWALGLLVGINMLFGGAALIAMALASRQSAIDVRAAAGPAKAGTQFPFRDDAEKRRPHEHEPAPTHSAGMACGTRSRSTPLAIPAMETTAIERASATKAAVSQARA